MVVWDIIIKAVASFGQNGSVGNSNSHSLEIITVNMRGALVDEKSQPLESVSDSTALGDFR